jgi:T-complex protein 1 subunit alpha
LTYENSECISEFNCKRMTQSNLKPCDEGQLPTPTLPSSSVRLSPTNITHFRESEIVLERIRKVLAAGANVVFTTKGIDDLCLKEFIEAGAMAVRRCRKEDLKRIAKATGGTLVASLTNLDGEETFEASSLGSAEEVVQERISDDELILVKGTKMVNSSSIILRGANDYMLDEMERALHDSLSIIKRTLESGSVVPGGGAVETALNVYLENFATTLVSCLSSHS